MSPHREHSGATRLVSYYRIGDAMQSRSVSGIVLSGAIDVPPLPARVLADWERETSSRMVLDPGDVEAMPLARTQVRWPDYARCVQAMAEWTAACGLPGVLAASEIALMACRGARYHHDAAQYGGAAFCNLFLSEDKGLDLHFPGVGHRIPLRRGTAVIFDTAQPHGVIPRHRDGFHEADFPPDRDNTQVFLTWELPIEDPGVRQALRTGLNVAPSTASKIVEDQVRLNDAPVTVCPNTGHWRRLA